MDTSVEVAGLRLDHAVINGSGTFDAIAARRAFGDALLDEFPFSMFVSKTITPQARAGNAPPRIFETPAGMINSIGLPNKGLAGFLDQDLPELAGLPVPLCVSVMATSHGELVDLSKAVVNSTTLEALSPNETKLYRSKIPYTRTWDERWIGTSGNMGDPTRATAEKGQQIIGKAVEVGLVVLEVLKEQLEFRERAGARG